MSKKFVYLDNNATTALEPLVLESMGEVMREPLNASATHSLGRKGNSIIEAARAKILKLANADEARVIFTASGTEANNLAIKGLMGYKVLVSTIEHPSVLKTAMENSGTVIPVMGNGIVDIAALEDLLKAHLGEKILISVMLANNETGIIQPLKEVVALAKKYNAIVHTDAAQCFGKIAVDMADLGVDMLTISAHKFGGPQGAAALVAKKSVPLAAQMIGGGQEQNYRAGTHNVAAICGFGVAVDIAFNTKSDSGLRDEMEKQLQAISPDVTIFGKGQNRLPNTSYIAMPNVAYETQLIHFDLNGIAVSAGSACSSGKIESSHVLRAMGVVDESAKTTIRVSLGKNNTKNDINTFILLWKQLYESTNAKRKVA
jgi:cysteine desulfurase